MSTVICVEHCNWWVLALSSVVCAMFTCRCKECMLQTTAPAIFIVPEIVI